MSDKVGMSLSIKATGSVEKSVEEDLAVEDPTPEKAEAILKGEDEDTEGHDGTGSTGSN
tara:strand:- start:200 stop:376 length:177 start_codon:yes stop_codon:yes gene_type:complete